jgi:L-threonylcarbamoyladenylate synthase
MTVLKITEDDFDAAVDIAAALLKNGGTMVYPTDTVYGIGADAASPEAVGKIRAIKGIGDKKPMSVMVSDLNMVDYFCETGVWEDIILRKYLPGPYTFILKKARDIPASDTGTLGVRIPDSQFCQAICRKFGRPIVTTSANPTAQAPPTRFEDVDKRVLGAVDLSIDGGQTKYGAASTVIDLVERRMLRQNDREWIGLVDLPER